MGKYFKSIFITFLFILLVDNVNALDLTEMTLLYRVDGTSYTYSSTNLNKSFSTQTTKEIEAFNIRYTLNDKFKTGMTYTIRYKIHNYYNYYNEDFTFKDDFERIFPVFGCYFTSSSSWSSSSTCFQNISYNIKHINVQEIEYSITFTPLKDIYRILNETQVNNTQPDEYTVFSTTYGWEVFDITYSESNSSGSNQDIVDSIDKNTQDIIDSQDKINDTLTDDTPPDTTGLADAPGWLPAGPVDSIVTLPINLLQSLTNNLESACTPINLPIPFIDDNLTLDCPATLLKRFDGFWLFWEGFGLIAGVWCLYKYFINLYKWVESHLSMDEKESLGKWGGV